METNNSYSLLVVGKTQESTEAQEYKRYIGLGSSFVVAVNPTKKELETIYGREQANDPEYVVDTDNGKEARVTFIVKTDPKITNGIEILSRVMFTLRNAPVYNQDKTKIQVIDEYGNTAWGIAEDVKAGKKLLSKEGKELKIADKYRMCCVGEADLVGFLKSYLWVQDAYSYINDAWVLNKNHADCVFALENIKDYFKGDFSEIKDTIAMQPNNKVMLLYGIYTTNKGKQYQTVATRNGMVLPNAAGSKAIEGLTKNLARAKASGSYKTTEFIVQPLAEFTVQPTDFSTPAADTSSPANDPLQGGNDMPWD